MPTASMIAIESATTTSVEPMKPATNTHHGSGVVRSRFSTPFARSAAKPAPSS